MRHFDGFGPALSTTDVALLLLQLFYKAVWLLAVALPLRSAGQWDSSATGFTKNFVGVVVLDVLVIPWAYVLTNYVKKPGDKWKFASFRQANPQPSVRT
jgi:hypothetical protein